MSKERHTGPGKAHAEQPAPAPASEESFETIPFEELPAEELGIEELESRLIHERQKPNVTVIVGVRVSW
jgi:hypothetical protein